VSSWLDIPTFATRRFHACHHARAPSSGRWNCGREMSGNFAEMTISTPFRDLLHVVKLRHGTDGFTSPPKEGALRIFFALKIRRELANLGTKGQHATSKPQKPPRKVVSFRKINRSSLQTLVFFHIRYHAQNSILYKRQ
jgi:hypothetical protein